MALDIHVPSLGDAEQGKDYDYKSRCEELESALNETRSALDEFQLSSRELEAELERELENMEKQYTDAKRQKERLRMESDEWKVPSPLLPKDGRGDGSDRGRINFRLQRSSLRRLRMRCKRRLMRCGKLSGSF